MAEEGPPIGGTKNINVYSPALKHEVSEPTDFSTGAVCVKTDFETPSSRPGPSPSQRRP